MGKTNQSETLNKLMMNHSLWKEARALLCEAIQGDMYKWAMIAYICTHCIFNIYQHILHYTFLTLGGFFFNQWKLKRRTLDADLISGPFTILDQENLCHWGRIVGIEPSLKRKLMDRAALESGGGGGGGGGRRALHSCKNLRFAICLLKSLERGSTSQNLYS